MCRETRRASGMRHTVLAKNMGTASNEDELLRS